MNRVEPIQLLDVVALTTDVPADRLVRGQVGTVVETPAPGVFLVEFADDDGRAYAIVSLTTDQLLRLRYTPVEAA